MKCAWYLHSLFIRLLIFFNISGYLLWTPNNSNFFLFSQEVWVIWSWLYLIHLQFLSATGTCRGHAWQTTRQLGFNPKLKKITLGWKRLIFLKIYLKRVFQSLWISKFSWGLYPKTSVVACTSAITILPILCQKPAYGPCKSVTLRVQNAFHPTRNSHLKFWKLHVLSRTGFQGFWNFWDKRDNS